MQFLRLWIMSIVVILFATMGIGAMTRLTGSGLSIVEWKPLSGVLPPLHETSWQEEFSNYQQYPDFKSRPDMTLAEFKVLFWWEFVHRLVARSILLVILVPYAFLVLRKRLSSRQHLRVLGLLILGGIQGFLGWFMVQSGLVSEPRVSHFRLMIHFLWACLILAYLARWLREESPPKKIPEPGVTQFVRVLSWVCFLQLALGALVAGSRAGYIYNTFPKFGDTWLPPSFSVYATFFENVFYNQINLQFFHRMGGWCFLFAGGHALYKELYGISSLIGLQFVLGILTLILAVPPPMATLHQLVGAFLFFYLRYLIPDSLSRGSYE